MKKLFYLLLLLPILFVGCKKNNVQNEEPEAVKLSVDPSSIISPSAGADYTLTLTAPEAWTATCADSWVKVTPSSGNAGTVEISVKIAADKSSTEANSKIVFKSGDQTVEVPVKRLAKEPARLNVRSETKIRTPKDGGVYSIKVESNIKWQISSNANWAKIDGQATKRDNAVISVTVDPATTPEETVATLTISPLEGSGVEKQTVTITRGGTDATSMTVTGTPISAPADGGNFTVNVQTTAKWKVIKAWDADWITLSTTTGNGNGSFDVKVSPASTTIDMSTIITIEEVRSDSYKPVQLNVLVSRLGKASAVLTVTPTSIESPAEGKDFALEIISNYPWSASLNGVSIFSVSTTSGEGNATMVVTVKPTMSTKDATGSIVIRSSFGNEEVKIPILRKGYKAGKEFSVSATKKVVFSKGNLQYQPSTKIWRFAEIQSDYIGQGNANIAESYTGWLDLFSWGTGNNPLGRPEGTNPTFHEWGDNPISNGGNKANMWRTLTGDEWTYVVKNRDNAKDLIAIFRINDTYGAVLMPDGYVSDKWAGIIDHEGIDITTEWSELEAEGAVFLPCAGYRYIKSKEDTKYNTIYDINENGYYWSATWHGGDDAWYYWHHSDGANGVNITPGKQAFSVRLVQDAN